LHETDFKANQEALLRLQRETHALTKITSSSSREALLLIKQKGPATDLMDNQMDNQMDTTNL